MITPFHISIEHIFLFLPFAVSDRDLAVFMTFTVMKPSFRAYVHLDIYGYTEVEFLQSKLHLLFHLLKKENSILCYETNNNS